MDLAIYINELLGLKGEVNVPGIGYFAQKRISGYFNEHENKFYPPGHEIVFDPSPRDDDGLAIYIHKKKNISEASAKYFIEKYTTGLKERASEDKVNITGLGSLYYEYSTLTFKADAVHPDPSFYGFSPVKTYKGTTKAAAIETPSSVEAQPVTEITVPETDGLVEGTPYESTVDTRTFIPQEVEEEVQPDHRRRNFLVVLLLIAMIILLGFGIAYQYNPGLFGSTERTDTTMIVKRAVPAGPKIDSAENQKSPKDSIANTAAPVHIISPAIDTFAVKHYDILGGTFKSLSRANIEMKNDGSLGLKPHLTKNGNYYTITLLTLFDKAAAQRTHDSIFNIKGVHKQNIYINTYIPKKK